MDSLDLMNEGIDQDLQKRFLKGHPRQCKHCSAWAWYEKPKGNPSCFSVECKSCNKEFDIVPNMIGSRK